MTTTTNPSLIRIVSNNSPTATTSATNGTEKAIHSRVPTVVLDTDVVSDNMAARLCTSFLSHVLFLKNQVPFPVVQLAKMPVSTTDNTSRATKKRHALLNSFDTLASHLYTTFIALSTALALRGASQGSELGRECGYGAARAFFAVALGPTVGSATSRVIVGIDGLETKVWGLREAMTRAENVSESESQSVSEDEEEEAEVGSETDEEDEDDASPPLSRSPSPTPSSSSDSDVSPSTSLRTEDPETVRAAERLLSRTLASACAEDDGHGLASEMAPTQIHVLLRAPRRFDHPSWIPRQNLCPSLDGHLADFLVASGEAGEAMDTTAKKRTKAGKVQVQGVWVKSRGGTPVEEAVKNVLAEEDELIWWSWDGKLVGFSDCVGIRDALGGFK